MAAVLTAGFASISPTRLRVTASVIRSFVTPAIYVPYPSAYGNQQQRFFSGAVQPTGSVTVGGSVVSATQTADSYGPLDGSGGGSSGFPVWAIAVTAGVGGAILCCVIVGIFIVCMRRKRTQEAAMRDRWLRAQTYANGSSKPHRWQEKPSRIGTLAAAGRRFSPNSLGTSRHTGGQKSMLESRTNFMGAKGVPVRPKSAAAGPQRPSSRLAGPAAAGLGLAAATHRASDHPSGRSSHERLLSNGSSHPDDGAWPPGSPLPNAPPSRPWMDGEMHSGSSSRRGSLPNAQSPYAYNAISGSESSPNLTGGGGGDGILASAFPSGYDIPAERSSRRSRQPTGPRSSRYAESVGHARSGSADRDFDFIPSHPAEHGISPRGSRRARSVGRPSSHGDIRGSFLDGAPRHRSGGRSSYQDLRHVSSRDSIRTGRPGRRVSSLQGLRASSEEGQRPPPSIF